MSRFSATASAILVALLVAACSGSSPSAQGSASQKQSASVAASESAPAGQSQGSEPSYAPGAGNLEGIVPTEVGGVTLDWTYASGQDVLGSEGITSEIQDFLDQAHADVNDITSAIGFAFDPSTETVITIFALRVAGADESALRDAFRTTMEADETNVIKTDTTFGGKNVLAVSKDGGETSTYLYVKDDVVFLIGASSEDLAADALSQLP